MQQPHSLVITEMKEVEPEATTATGEPVKEISLKVDNTIEDMTGTEDHTPEENTKI